ncbi:hypothetical protein PA25_18890 [Pseudoalteromonas sp. A25]|uniref:transglycosylase SLT domain-containing protein n=1 Tax=Pseudoalteromonas sp. A25 TaxID=116092 RepID=UPI0012612D20|nr:transglycosylase SLT domain-containing protein [Pseudoalteromonas sp. A25]BBN81904.1 hypothetical protein PA25_18890 [Pseudoalteromonas sp. A25]
MVKKLVTVALSTQLVVGVGFASQDVMFSELDEAMRQWQSSFRGVPDESSEFEQFKQQHLNAYQDYVAEHFAQFDAYRDELIAKWGEAKTSDKAQYVDYNNENNTRMLVDFENERLSIAIRHPHNESPPDDYVDKAFQTFLSTNSVLLDAFFAGKTPTKLSSDELITSSYEINNVKKAQSLFEAKQAIKHQVMQQQQLLEQQLDNKLAMPSEQSDAQASETLLNKKRLELKQLQAQRLDRLKSNIKKLVKEPKSQSKVTEFSITLKSSERRPKRAKKYQLVVADNSQRFNIAPSLVFSVIHTESHFNPLAKSSIPAFGLMQIVPTSAGVDVNRFLYNRDEPMIDAYLYVADNNVEAGAAYLHILDKRYLKHIADPLSRKYCMIAAYNTGAGNVARVFNSDDSRNIKKASRIINSMTPERVLEALEQGLPYDETKHYLKQVLEREALYQSL